MKRTDAGFRNRRPIAGIVLLLVWAMGCSAAVQARDLPQVSQADFPSDDAVVLRHVQNWTLAADGGVVYEEHRWVKLLNDRAWRRYSDPRVDYRDGLEAVELLTAVAHLPDGTVVDIPDYSTIVVSPGGISTWPALSDRRQMVYVFSGLQNGAVLEFHYKRTSKPGVRRWLEADLRVGDIDPVIERVVQVNLPADQKLRHVAERLDKRASLDQGTTNGQATYSWTIRNVPSDADEPGSPRWQQRCGRLRFTNCPSATEWVSELIRTVESSAQVTERITEFAEQAAKDEVDEAGKVRAIAGKLGDTFNFVNDWRGWAGRRVRPADEVFGTCYGSRLESAALALATLRSIGIDARVRVAVEGDTFDEEVATDTQLVALVIEPSVAGGPIWWEPSSGIINPNSPWRNRVLLYLESDKLQQFAAFASWRSQPDSARVRGQLVLDDKAEKLTGSLSLELTGVFLDPEKLRSDDEKRSLIESTVNRVAPDLKVTDWSVSHLSKERFAAQVTVESQDLPAELYDRRILVLAADTPALAQAHLPLDPSTRRTPVRLLAHLSAELRLRIELPEDWRPVILPEPLHAVSGKWGRIAQQVEADDDAVRIVRQVSFAVLAIEPDDFATVRQAVRTLRSHACRTLVIEKSESAGEPLTSARAD